jgi:diguanylate cyclase (GGDEF)-like protein/PAS domain S-box-containing protein
MLKQIPLPPKPPLWRSLGAGFLLGCLFPVVALISQTMLAQPGWSLALVWQAYATEPAYWLISLSPIFVMLVFYEIGRRRYAEQVARQQRDFFQQVIDALGEGVSVTTFNGTFTFVNKAYTGMVGLSAAELSVKTPFDVSLPEDHHILHAARAERQSGKSSIYQARLQHTNGQILHAQIHAVPYLDAGKVVGSVAAITDVSKKVELERTLRQERDFIATVIETVDSLIVVVDKQGKILHFNRACELMSGYQREQVLDLVLWEALVPPDQADAVKMLFADLHHSQVVERYEKHWCTRNNELRLISWSHATVVDESGAVAYIIGTGVDVTELRWMEEKREQLIVQLHDQATRDSLTELFNRRHFFTLAEEAYSLALSEHRDLAMIMLDIDHFKRVNDTYGHGVGDQVLCNVAEQCRRNLREEDIIGRYGGEEFAIILVQTSLAEALVIAERLRLALAETPIKTSYGTVQITLSIGVAAMTVQTTQLADILNEADLALYCAKRNGRNRVETLPSTAPEVYGSATSNAN